LEFLTYLPDDLLVKVDRVTMALGLEARVPLLDQALVELVFSRPATQIGTGKAWLRRVAGQRLPEALLTAPKQGFSIPRALWSGGLFAASDTAAGRRAGNRQEQVLRCAFPEMPMPAAAESR
ncbi:MAG: asparagine synthase-related protein, partial [Pseudomonadota bacterium]